MNTIAFTGFLSLKDKNSRKCTLNTNNVVGLYQDKNSSEITIKSTDKSCVELSGYRYADVQKALIEADKKGFYDLVNENKSVDEDIYDSKPHSKNSDVLDTPKEGTKGDDIFDYISPDLKGHGGELCPNSLNDINIDLRHNQHYYIDSDYSKRVMKACDDAFEILPPLEQEETFYRAVYGIHLDDEILQAKEGDIITPDRGYAQVALDLTGASKYLPSKNCKPILFEMKCPKGSKVSKTKSRLTGSGYPEAFMPRAQKFKLLSKSIENVPTIGGSQKYTSVSVYKMEYVCE